MAHTTTTPTPPHNPECRCGICQFYQTTRSLDEAAQVYHVLQTDDSPVPAHCLGNARYIPRQPFLALISSIIGPTRKQSANIYRLNYPGRIETTIEIPAWIDFDAY